jgi:hypothetical protein
MSLIYSLKEIGAKRQGKRYCLQTSPKSNEWPYENCNKGLAGRVLKIVGVSAHFF